VSGDALISAFGMPAFLAPWADRFFEPAEVELIGVLADAGEGAAPASAELLARVPALTEESLARAHRRGIVTMTGAPGRAPSVSLADFHQRLEVWALFEGWKDLPDEIREQLVEWELADYVESVRGELMALRDGRPAEGRQAEYSYLLLDEAEAAIHAEEHVYLWPCDCRAIFGRCDKPVNVCLRFDNDRGLGWEISKERAVEILRETDRAGLMHTDYVGRSEADPHAICNCCTDCCFPHLAAERLGVTDVWPRRLHRAVVDHARCGECGRCTRRCPFGALRMDAGGDAADGGAGRPGETRLVLRPELCRGCGLCATGCPEAAIVMDALDGR
jgi:ferredoxin